MVSADKVTAVGAGVAAPLGALLIGALDSLFVLRRRNQKLKEHHAASVSENSALRAQLSVAGMPQKPGPNPEHSRPLTTCKLEMEDNRRMPEMEGAGTTAEKQTCGLAKIIATNTENRSKRFPATLSYKLYVHM